MGRRYSVAPTARETALLNRPTARPAGPSFDRLRTLAWICLGLALIATFGLLQLGQQASGLHTAATPAPQLATSLFTPLPGARESQPLTSTDRSRLASAYGALPLAFEQNQGQLDRRALYMARGPGYTLFLTHRAAVLKLAPGRSRSRSAVLRIGLVGASASAPVVGERGLRGKANYLIGSVRSRWRTNVPTFGRVAYRNAWPGVSAAFYGNQGQLEYDFDVAARADPGSIKLSFSGARSLRVDRAGALLLGLPGGSVRQLTPRAYQLAGGHRHAVTSRYVVTGRSVHLRLGHYDHRLPLTVDPTLAYSTYIGGSGNTDDQAYGIAVDSSGSAYITGLTFSTNFPTTTGADQSSSGGARDAFVTKLSPDGSSLAYSTYLGGSADDYGLGVAVDAAGAAYVTGYTNSTNFPTTSGAFKTTGPAGGGYDAFVTKLAPDGGSLGYSTYLGGSGFDQATGIAVDASGDAYVSGYTTSADLATTTGAYQTTSPGGGDGFVTKLAADGKSLSYSTYLGGSGHDSANGIAIDSTGAAYVTGDTQSTNYPTTTGAFQTSFGGGQDAFVTKLAPNGKSVPYSTYLGGSDADQGLGIALDSTGAAYVTGDTQSTNYPTTTGAFQTSPAGGGGEAFVTKLAPDGTSLPYSTYLGGSGFEDGVGIAVDSADAAYITGITQSTDFPTTTGAFQTSSGGGIDAFVTKLATDGTALAYSTYLGSSGADYGQAIAADSLGGVYVTGRTGSTSFPTTTGAYQTSSGGGDDVFVTKFAFAAPTPVPPPTVAPPGGTPAAGAPIAITNAATAVTARSARLNGSVNPQHAATTYHFEYGTSTSYGKRVPASDLGVGSDGSTHAESQTITGLVAGRTYHFRIVARNASGTSRGVDRRFTTPLPAAQPKTLRLSVSPRSTLSGRTCFDFRVSSGGHRIAGATIRFVSRSLHSSPKGAARICLALRAGTYRAHAAKHGFKPGQATVRVRSLTVPRRTPPPPRFTG